LTDDLQQLRAVYTRHAHIRHDGIEGTLFNLGNRSRSAFDEDHVPTIAQATQTHPQAIQNSGIVVDE
jgi:hypothetical protein